MICRISGHLLAHAAALLLSINLLAVGAARAADRTWNDGSDNWTVAGDWTPSGAPGGADNAIFRSGSGATYTVTFPGSGAGGGLPAVGYATDQLRVGNNSVTFADPVVGSLVPSTYSVNNATTAEAGRGIIVGELSTDTAAVLTTQLATFSGVAATIGDASGSNGTLNISAGTFNVTGSGTVDFELIVGRNGAGTMNVSGTTTANVSGAFGDSVLAENVGSTGTVSVSGGANWMTSLKLYIGNSGSGTMNVSAGGQVSSNVSRVANNGPSTSTVTVTGAGSTWTNSAELYVGNSGAGTLNVLSGGQVSSSGSGGYLGYNASATGNATVSGNGSKWSNSYTYVGYFGSGTLNVTNSGFVSDNYGYIASEPMSTGMVSLDGINTSWSSTHDLYIGNSGNGTLNVSGGANVTSINGFLGFSANSSGAVSLSGASSLWQNSNNITVGGLGSGILTVGSGSLVSVGGTLTVGSLGTVKGSGSISGIVQNGGTVAPGASPGILTFNGSYAQTPAGKLQIEIGGTTPGTGYDQLTVSGAVTLGGTLQVSLINSFAPALGNRFDILDWGSRTAAFSTVTLPPLSGTLAWGTSALYSAGILSVIDTNYLPGDFNRNGQLSVADVGVLESALKDLSAYQATHGPGGGALTSAQLVSLGDLTGDGLVTNADLQGLIVYLANGGPIAASQITPVTPVPEPGAAFLLTSALGFLALARRLSSGQRVAANLDSAIGRG
jgi:T5SS/PEP-CTERM-associated repeat protein